MTSALRYGIIFILVTLIACFLYHITYFPYKACDDAYIYFTYAKNFSNGHGFVYNPGGERVEGFTSMLWMWIVILAYTISTDNFYSILLFLNCVLISYSLYRVVVFIDNYYLRKNTKAISWASLAFVVSLMIIKGFADWTIFSLLETGLWSALLILSGLFLMEVAAGVVKSSKQRLSFSLIIGLLVLTRPESALWAICFITIYGFLFFLNGHNKRELLKIVSVPLLTFVFCLIGLTAFRLYYFGYPLANTYYAKVSSDRLGNIKEGISYLIKFVYIYPVYYFSFVASLILLVHLAKQFFRFKKEMDGYEKALYVNVVIIGASFVVPMVNGGDHFSLFRLFQPVAPFFLLLFFNPFLWKYVSGIKQSYKSWPLAAAIIVIPFLFLINMPKYFISTERTPSGLSLLPEFSGAETNVKESTWLNQFFNFQPKPSMGRVWAGAHAFAYDGNTIDLMGLNNTLMAHAQEVKVGPKNHAAFDIKTFFILKPDLLGGELISDTSAFILPESKPDFAESFENSVFKGMFYDKRFVEMYSPAMISSSLFRQSYFTYIRNDYINVLRKSGLTVALFPRKQAG